MKFFMFNQNNSGGYFDVDENVCHRVVIEADSEEEAVKLFEPMIENQSGSCSCCGDRWSPKSCDEIDLSFYRKKGYLARIHHPRNEQDWEKRYGQFPVLEEPKWSNKYEIIFEGRIYFENLEQYLQFMANEYGWTVPDISIHYQDGTKKEIFTEEYD